jgi:translation elongation factor EF-Ts
MNCETDFVSKGETFTELMRQISSAVKSAAKPIHNSASILPTDSLKSLTLHNNQTIGDAITEVVAKLGENIQLRYEILCSKLCFSQLSTGEQFKWKYNKEQE